MTSQRRDRGSASIWVLSCSALLLVVAVVVVVRIGATAARHRAEFAADAAALAAAGEIGRSVQPCAAAEAIAAGNGAQVETCRLTIDVSTGRSGQVDVTVVTSVRLPILGSGTIRAHARAERDPP